MKAWQVGPYGYDDAWSAIVHANTRAEAKQKIYNETADTDEWIKIRAIRVPEFDDCAVTVEALRRLGYNPEGDKIVPRDFTWPCGCELCRRDSPK